MFNLTYTTPCPIQGEILVEKLPQQLGVFTDVKGCKFHLKAYMTDKDYLNSIIGVICPIHNLHPYYYDTSTTQYGFVQQTWKPYRIKLSNENEI